MVAITEPDGKAEFATAALRAVEWDARWTWAGKVSDKTMYTFQAYKGLQMA